MFGCLSAVACVVLATLMTRNFAVGTSYMRTVERQIYRAMVVCTICFGVIGRNAIVPVPFLI